MTTETAVAPTKAANHTPGPWNTIGSRPVRASNFDKTYRMRVYAPGPAMRPGTPAGYQCVARSESMHSNQCEANARLIAEAPTLAAFVRGVEPLLSVWMEEHPHAFTGKDILTEARQLIARLDGKEG